ncbi:uncharacterized protein LOC108740648 [Agrilus planipennis]|uniref:Uncharacterized protein LOC108740648 n=1 Tax=Agrilus planipennis TaxID=224129 RepID=A0A1W4XDW8_AGRPL|nr:uncharacterized protein LOC108740648 [Agrilus planipennis]XP_018330540.1 uncharacterized protein LOC108740648 [Agrilus planipennis]
MDTMEREKETKEADDAQIFFDFFVDLLENHRETAVYYFSENALLDWFGQTVRGEKGIRGFFRTTIATVTHEFKDVTPVSKIGYRDSHVVQLPVKKSIRCETLVPGITELLCNSEKTPPNKPLQRINHNIEEKGQGDGFHVEQSHYHHSPPKRLRMEQGQGDAEASVASIKYLSTNGYVEFHKKSSKKLQTETKWKRPCKLEIAYSIDPVEKYIIHLVIYEGNMKCRKNLLKDFEACHSKDVT